MTVVAIVGKTNVGKSTFFNRLCGRKTAIVHDQPGVTRDWREGKARLADLQFTLLDTAGLEASSELSEDMWAQTQKAMQQADVILMMVDGRADISALDRRLAQLVRQAQKPYFLLVNKCESQTFPEEAYSLGLGDPLPVSGAHGLGLAELYQVLQPHITEDADTPKQALKLAVVGRPNVGKSTLVNALLKQERMLTGAQAGVTRDAISTVFTWQDQVVELTDTAGMRRRSKQDDVLEQLAAQDSVRALNQAQVVVVVLDAQKLFEKQDLQIARQVVDEGRALVIALNKWDLIKDKNSALSELNQQLQASLQQVKGVACVPISAVKKTGLDDLMKAMFHAYALWNKRVPTHKLNDWLKKMTEKMPPPVAKNGRRIPMRYMTQVGVRPPTFVIFSSNPAELPESYLRYLTNGLRTDYGLMGVPIRLNMRKRQNPYAKNA
ncbi:MAG: ribosome biogenesis GTPase Der [Alphaproteobacteria bacterium]|nr:ribosome biogenesis GTPase Der [Alphaproteobacteria bacterium]